MAGNKKKREVQLWPAPMNQLQAAEQANEAVDVELNRHTHLVSKLQDWSYIIPPLENTTVLFLACAACSCLSLDGFKSQVCEVPSAAPRCWILVSLQALKLNLGIS